MNIPSNIYEKFDENIVGKLSPHAAVHANALNTKGILYTGPLIRSNLKPQAPGEPWAKLHDNGKPLWPTQGNGKRCWARQARELLLHGPTVFRPRTGGARCRFPPGHEWNDGIQSMCGACGGKDFSISPAERAPFVASSKQNYKPDSDLKYHIGSLQIFGKIGLKL